jgi:hypothetical protein
MNRKSQLLRNAPYIILFITIISLIVVLNINPEVPLVIISKDTVYSQFHTDELETLQIKLLTNKPTDYHFIKDQVISSKIINEEQNISVNIKEIEVSNLPINYNEVLYYPLTISLKIPVNSTNHLLYLDQAKLSLIYENLNQIEVPLGELNYQFLKENPADLVLGNLSATYEKVEEQQTVGGVFLELHNQTNHNIYIKSIDIVSKQIHLNNQYITIDHICDYLETVVSCLGLSYYHFFDSPVLQTNTLLRSNNHISLYVPLSYNRDFTFIERFAIAVVYEMNSEEKIWYIDDFPYLNTSPFQSLEEGTYHESFVIFAD